MTTTELREWLANYRFAESPAGAAMRERMKPLLDELDALRAERDRLREALDLKCGAPDSSNSACGCCQSRWWRASAERAEKLAERAALSQVKP